MKTLKDAVIVAYGRSPIGRATKGTLVNEYPVKLATEVLLGVLDKVPNLPLNEIDDVIVGCSTPEDVQGLNMARIIVIRAGLERPELTDEVCGVTVSRFCSSGLQSIAFAANEIMADQADIIVAGGVESMSMCPMTVLDLTALDPKIFKERAACYLAMGTTAEVLTDMFDVKREDMDKFALNSHQKASKAQKEGAFKKEIIPVTYTDKDGAIDIMKEDECIKHDATYEDMAKLPAAFKENGSVTAGNSSPMNDGVGFVVMMSADKAAELGIKPIAKFLGYAVAGVSPEMMGIGPVYAVPKLLNRIGMELDQFDVIELNEAFAVQSLICADQLGFDPAKLNPRGGAIAMGHPLGATGAILTCKALSYLQDTGGKYGLITMCIGAGMGAAGAIEML